MSDDLLQIADMYAAGLEKVEDRREQWMTKYIELRDHLKEVAAYLNNSTLYKQGFFVDTLHAFNEDINGTTSKMPSITFRSGDMSMQITFHNSMGEKKSYVEDGFHISFNPTVTGQVVVLLLPHQSPLNKDPLPYSTLAVINEPGQLTMEMADKILALGMKAAFYTSFTGMSEQPQQDNSEAPGMPSLSERNPIGFKRYETTEKVK